MTAFFINICSHCFILFAVYLSIENINFILCCRYNITSDDVPREFDASDNDK